VVEEWLNWFAVAARRDELRSGKFLGRKSVSVHEQAEREQCFLKGEERETTGDREIKNCWWVGVAVHGEGADVGGWWRMMKWGNFEGFGSGCSSPSLPLSRGADLISLDLGTLEPWSPWRDRCCCWLTHH